MINDELLAKFDSLENLPVSEEMLGAYMEGTLSAKECDQIEDILASNTDFASFFDDVSEYNEVYDGSLISVPDLFEITEFPALFEANVAVHDTDEALPSVDIFQDMGGADDFDNADSFINPDSTSSFETDSVGFDSFNNTNSDMLDTDASFGDNHLFE